MWISYLEHAMVSAKRRSKSFLFSTFCTKTASLKVLLNSYKTSKSQQEKLDEKQKTNSSTPETTTVQTDITSAEKKLEGNNTKEHKRSNAPGVAIVIISICCALIAYWVKKGKLSVKKGNGTTTNREEPKK